MLALVILIASPNAFRVSRSSWPGLSRPSASLLRAQKDVDARDKPGHDGNCGKRIDFPGFFSP
jgi:hypothetical protein